MLTRIRDTRQKPMTSRQKAQQQLDALVALIARRPNGIGVDDIGAGLDLPISHRTLQRRLASLVEQGRIEATGLTRALRYRIKGVGQGPVQEGPPERRRTPAQVPITDTAKEVPELVSRPMRARAPVGYERAFVDAYRPNVTSYLSDQEKAWLREMTKTRTPDEHAGMRDIQTTPPASPHKKTAGGKAANAGPTFQAQTLACVAVHALARKSLPRSFGGQIGATAVLLKHETGSGVDDALIQLEPKGRLWIQATTAPTPTKTADFLQQAAETWLEAMTGGSEGEFTPRLDRAHDALVLVVPHHKAPERLGDLHNACRQFDEVTLWPDAQVERLSQKQREAVDLARDIFAKAYIESRGNPPANDELVELFAMVRVVRVDVGDGGRDHHDALNLLRQDVLADSDQAENAWNLLLVRTLEAMQRARGARREGLAQTLAKEGYALKESVGAGRTTTQFVGDAVAANTAALQDLKASLRTPGDADILKQHAESQLKGLLAQARQRVSLVEPGLYRKEITDLAKRCIEGDLSRASAELRFQTVIFAVRSNASDQSTEQLARELLDAARKIDPAGCTRLAEATLLGLTDVDAAMRACRELDTPDACSQLFAFLRDARGNQAAHDWLVGENLAPNDFNPVGAVNVAVNALMLDLFDLAADWVEKVPQLLVEENPALQFLRGQIRLASTVPADQRQNVLQGLPRHLGIITFAQTPAAFASRRKALADFKSVEPRLAELDLPEVESAVAEFILWLEIVDPETREAAKAKLAADLRDPKLAIQRARLGISFEVGFDRAGLQAELLRRRHAGGWTDPEAATALLLALASDDYAKVTAFIAEHREELGKAKSLTRHEIVGIEIEALARSGAVTKARARLQEVASELPVAFRRLLEKVLAECDGTEDEVELARQNYEKDPGTDELRLYCGALARKKDNATLAEHSAELARRTMNAGDLLRAVNVLRRLSRWRSVLNLLNQLQDVEGQDNSIQLARAEASFRTGDVNGARVLLDQTFKEAKDAEVVQLSILVSLESGDWGHLQAIIDGIRSSTSSFTPLQLARFARLARHSGSSYAQDLMDEALKRANDDPHIYIAAYTLAMTGGEEDDERVHEWFRKAVELSGESGPVERKSLKDIVDMAPAWREREERANSEVRLGNAPLFIAARSLNITVTNAALGRGLANLGTADASRRSPILAFDGSRRTADLSNLDTVALDLSALFTLTLLNLLPNVLGAFSKVVVGFGTLTLLFEERARIRFHQPSRVAKAKRLKELIDKGAIKVLEPIPNLPRELVAEVGEDLAGLLVRAREVGGMVVQPGPLHKIGTFLETEAELGDYSAQITDTRQALAFLKAQGALTANLEKDARSYIERVDRGMLGAKAVVPDVPLFLDDLAVSYLEHTGTLKALTERAASVTISEQSAAEVRALIGHEEHAEELLGHVERIRAALEAGIRSGRVIISEGKPLADENADDDDIRQSPTMALLQAVTPFQAIVVDDKALNRLPYWEIPAGRAATMTTLDLLHAVGVQNELSAAEKSEALRLLRVANFQVVGTSEGELVEMLGAVTVNADGVVETQEMRALRENMLTVAASGALQPREEPWLMAVRYAFLRAIRELWVTAPASAPAKAAWLLSALPSPADFCPLPLNPEVWANVRNLEAAETALFLNSLSIDEPHREAYKEWVTTHILNPIIADDPDRFERTISYYKKVIKEVANGRLD